MIDFSKLRLDDLVRTDAPPVEWALRYASVGMKLTVAYRYHGKWRFPTPDGIKDATNDPAIITEWFREKPYYEALWAGEPGHAVLDLDRKNGKDGPSAFENLTGLVVSELNTPIASTPHGDGAHVYVKTNGIVYGPYDNVGDPGIELCATARAGKGDRGVALPLANNGREWRNQLSGPWIDMPPFFVDWMKRKAEGETNGSGRRSQHSFTGETKRARRKLNAARKALAEAGPGERDATVGRHVLYIGSLVGAGELDEETALNELLEAARRNPHADEKYIDRIARAFATGMESPAPPRTKAPKADWLDHAILDQYGQPMPNLANALTAIRYTPELADALAYDELLRAAVLSKELPIVQGARLICGRPLPRPVIDEDVTQLQEWLQHAGMPRLSRDTVHQAVDRHSRDHSFHKLRDWLSGLKWDGIPRLEKWGITYLGAPDTEYHRQIGKMFVIAMVARVFEPGCQADYVLILQGDQGERKSTALRILAGDEYFSDSLPDIHSKDANQHVRGMWLIEIGELSAMSRSDIESWKAFVTRRTERYRPPYGRKETIEPRQCVFAGSTNKQEYLHDETGNRRFWPFLTGVIDLDALKQDREQLFAEAVDLYRAGAPWWPIKEFEAEHIVPQQELRFEEDAWQPLVADWLAKIGTGKDPDWVEDPLAARKVPKDPNHVLVHEVALHACEVTRDRLGTAEQHRISRVLHRLGWRQHRSAEGRFYYRPGFLPKDTR
jgi:predicted P-loop ATPase